MNTFVYRKIMREEGVTRQEAIEIWEEELKCQNGDVFEALLQFGLEPDAALEGMF